MPIIDAKTAPTVRRNNSTKQRVAETPKTKRVIKMPHGLMHRTVAALPIVGTNITAVAFQLSWAHDVLHSWGQPGAILYAFTVESIAISIAYHAHLADKENLKSGQLHLASMLVAISIGLINGSHELSHSLPLAIIAFMVSTLSPLLWRMFSRQVAAPILAKNGQLDYHGIRLGMDRYLYHPIRSFQVKRESAWTGERSLIRATRTWEEKRARKASDKAIEKNRGIIDSELEGTI